MNFTCDDYQGLWKELKHVFEFWIARGVKIFRVDNPHTKSFPFWEWCLGELRRQDPSLIFLAEAFTRPKTMYTLAKLGFNNSYTYFTWRNSKEGLQFLCPGAGSLSSGRILSSEFLAQHARHSA